MNTEDLHIALQQSFSPDASLRNPAETVIKGLKHVEGAPAMLLQITNEKQVQFEVRQAAAIQLKNLCKSCWAEKKNFMVIPSLIEPNNDRVLLKESDKEQVKQYIVEVLLAETEKSIQDLLAETIYHIVTHDFPENWPSLLSTILQTIQQPDLATNGLRVHNALVALRKICKRYEYKSKEHRIPLDKISEQFFPILLPLAQRFTDPNEHSLEAALTLKLILKIFWSSTQHFLPQSIGGITTLLHPEVMQPWFEVLEKALSKKLPEADTGLPPLGQPTKIEEREKWPWWKVKKWTAKIIVRIFDRYGSPNKPEKEVKIFANYFSKQVAPQLLGPICEILNLRSEGHFCTNCVMHKSLSFIENAIELASTYKMLKPHIDFILYKVCFPTICMSGSDIELFDHDPHEFIHRELSLLNEFLDPRSSATKVVQNLVKYRGQDTIKGLLVFLTDNLNSYANGSQNHVHKDGCLQIIGCLNHTLFDKKDYALQIEPLLVTHVFPDFNSQVGFLRSRACCIVQNFDFIVWSDMSNFYELIRLVLQSLSDPSLPVQFEASKALRLLVQVEGADKVLLPVLPKILEELSRIMNEIGNDEVISALQKIISQFGDHIEPHAVVLVNQLCTAFSSFHSESEDDEAEMAAAQCLECISTVLKGVCDRPDIYKQLEPLLLPMIVQLLGNDGEYIEYLDNVLEILTCLTYFQTELSPQIWETFPLIYNAFDQWAPDYLFSMVPVFENFIGRGTHHFLNGAAMTPSGPVKHIDLIFRLVEKSSSDSRTTLDTEIKHAFQLFMVILHHCRGLVDNYLPAINEVVLMRLEQIQREEARVNKDALSTAKVVSPMTKKVIFQIIGSAFHYNPTLQLNELEQRGLTQQVFTLWLNDCDNLESWLSKKVFVLGLSSILLMPKSSIPQPLYSGFPHIIDRLTLVMEKMQDESDHAPDEQHISEEEKERINKDELQCFDENEDVQNNLDDMYLDAIHDQNDFARFLFGDEWDDEWDDEDYDSPIDDIDTLSFYTDALRGFCEREPTIENSLAPSTITSFQKLLAISEEEKKKGNRRE